MRSRASKDASHRSSVRFSEHTRSPPMRTPPPSSHLKKDGKEEKKKNRCMRILLSTLFSFGILIGVALLMPSTIDPIPYDLPPAPSLVGPLSQNEALKSTDKMFEFFIRGPESIAIHDDVIYTGTVNGRIMKIEKDGRLVEFARLGRVNCSSFPSCGRPLGMRVDPTKKFLYVVDAYLGLFKINFETGKHEKLFPFNDDFKVTFFNDFDFLPNGDIVLSETSTRFPLHSIVKEVLESGHNGRLLLISPGTYPPRFEVIRTGLCFTNGVQFEARDGESQSVLVAETVRNRILRVFVNGKQRGEVEIFAENIPGMPDNIRRSEAGDGYWVGFAMVRSQEFVGLSDYLKLSTWPSIRSAIDKVIPAPIIHQLARTKYGLVVKFNLEGKIVASLHDTNGSVVRDVSEVVEHGGALYLGNYDSSYIGRLDQSCKETKTCRFQKPETDNQKEKEKKKEL